MNVGQWLMLTVVGLAVLLASATVSHSQQVSYEGEQVLRFTVQEEDTTQRVLAWVEQNTLDLWAVHPKWVDVRMDNVTAATRAKALGVPFTVMIKDLEADIRAERQSNAQAAAGFFDVYHTYEEYNTFLDELATAFPALVTKKTIGKTVEGRDINGVVVTAPNSNPKTRIVFNGGQHAREWIGPITVCYITEQLVSLYGSDAQVTRFLDSIEFSIFPQINVDGYIHSWNTARMWRKNRRLNQGSCAGVDNNRNWGYEWGHDSGSSSNPCSEVYRGPSPFSEPEETALAEYIKTLTNVRGYIDWHSYSQLILGPWGYTSTTLPKDVETQNELAKLAAEAIMSVHGMKYIYGPSGPTLYLSSGGSNDWTYGAQDITYSYVIELRDTGRYGFILPATEIIPTGEESFAAVRVFADYILNHPPSL